MADVAERIIGEKINHPLCWRTVQQEGGRLIDEKGRHVDAIFGDQPAQLPEVTITTSGGQGQDRRPEILRREDRGCSTPARDGPEADDTGRWALVGKGVHATTDDADSFGKTLATKGFHEVGLHQARQVVCVHDGLDAFGGTFRASQQLGSQLQQIGRRAGMLYESALFLEDFFSFLELTEKPREPAADQPGLEPFQLLEVQEVSFAYPGPNDASSETSP